MPASLPSGGADSGARLLRVARAGALCAAGAAAWGWFEAGWPRLRTLELPLARLAPELDGLRIAHLSDFHLGVPSRGAVATKKAVAWVEERRPDLVAITGDLLTRSRGELALRGYAARLATVAPTFAILGNHDFAISRDPFVDRSPLADLGPVRLLSDEHELVELRGKQVLVAGSDPRSRWSTRRPRPADLSADADLRLLLLHYPRLVDELPAGRFELVLAGHMHGGQINLPYPGGRLQLAHLGARFTRGLYRLPQAALHVSAGLGTTFVPFRFAARPEATELVLRAA